MLKVAALNGLYNTNIFGLNALATHISKLAIDPLIAAGSPEAVEAIAHVTIGGKVRHVYSFATKYCSWHNPACFPIYDTFVESLLVRYRRKDSFALFRTGELRSFRRFVEVISAFREFYGLGSFSFKEIDKFLWFEARALRTPVSNPAMTTIAKDGRGSSPIR